ncbi:importin subunit alpha-8 [Pelomyxa schiedti]|nr:importin subunit alpha-8 [Pelomyxa schiedti]
MQKSSMSSTASTAPTTKESPTVADLLIASESAMLTLDQLLQAQANSLAVDRADFEAETKHTHIVEFGPTVKLDVGGKIFRISRSDLIKERSLLSNTYNLFHASSDVILNYLRTGKIFQPSDPAALEEVEAEFYEVDNMITVGNPDSRFLVTHPHHSSPSDPTHFCSCMPQEYDTVKFTKAWLLCPSYYTVSYSDAACSRSNWILSASSDGVKWETLSTHTALPAKSGRYSWPITTTHQFNQFRVTCSGKNGNWFPAFSCFHVYGLELYGTLETQHASDLFCCPATATATPTTTTTNTVPQLLAVSSSVAEAASAANSNDRDVALTGVVQLRRLLCSEKPPIDEVIAAGLLPRLGQFLSLSDNPNFQVEALWALTNICTGSTKQIEEVLKCGIVPQLIALLSSSPDVDVCQQATWALSNILGDCAVHRDSVLRLGFFPVLLKAIVKFPNKVFFLRKATEAISNGCRGVPPPDISYFRSPNDAGESVSPLPVLAALLQYLDAEVVTHACWALSYMAESPLCIKLIISTGTIIPSLTRLLSISDTNIQRPALRALGNVANGSTEEAQSLIDAGIFQAVMPLYV